MIPTLRSKILQLVSYGTKSVDLFVNLAADDWTYEQISDELLELIKSGEILEIEYILPQLPYRSKSFFLPQSTEIRIVK